MTQIKKMHRMSDGVQVYPQTHTKAVIDDNGYTAESRLQAMQDEINQAQLEVGAVPSDLAPTENSTNWVTSGGVYNSISSIDEDLYGTKIYNEYIEGKYFYQDTGAINNDSDWAISSDYIPCSPSDTVRIIFGTTGKANYACLSVYASDKTWIRCRTTNGFTNERATTVGDEANIGYVRFCFYLPNIEQCEAYINDKLVWNYSGRLEGGLISRLSSYYGTDSAPVKDSTNVVMSGGVYSELYNIRTNAEKLNTNYFRIIPLDTYSLAHINWYINATNNWWDASSNTKSFFFPIKPNTKYRIVAGENGARYALLKTDTAPVSKVKPDYATGETALHIISPNGVHEFITPEDALWMNVNTILNNVGNILPERIEEYVSINELVEKVELSDLSSLYIENMQPKAIIDARVSSPTFGKVITATNKSWMCTQYIDLIGAKYVKYYANTISTSNNYAGVTGTVYYDENYEPLEEGVRLIEYGSAYKAEWITEEIPSGARYMRIGLGTGMTGFKIYRFKLLAEDIYGLQEKIDEIDEKANKEEYNILRNSRYSADGATSGTVGFLHFSDIHGDEGAAKAIKAYYDKYSSYINNMLSTGDVVYYYAADGIDFYTQNGLTDALMALGNHDGASKTGSNVQGSADWDAMGAQWDYETYYAPYISGWGVTQPTDAATNYLMYYYKDYTTPKVRLIVLDVMHQTAEQLQWFTDTLADAVTNDYTVVVASHYIPNTFVETNVVKKSNGDKTSFHWLNSNEITSIDSRFKLATTYADAVETFIANGGKFAVWLCGHYHTDYLTYCDTHPNILFCAINQAGYRRGGAQGYRVVGDHCANMVTIHPALGVIKLHRIGLTTDKYLRPINVLVYDYVNKKVISNY